LAFYGCEFSFNGIPSSQFGLMLYDFGSPVEDGIFSSGLEISEDRTARRYRPLFYGVTQNTPLTFELTFGVNPDSIDADKPLDRWDMAAIATWLTGQDGYRYLEIAQPDMEAMRYRCIITDLSYVTYGKMPWAMRCTVTCDSPFAYLRPETSNFNATNATTNIPSSVVLCRAATKYYYPTVTISFAGNSGAMGGAFSIVNHSDGDREFKFTGLNGTQAITIDNENEIITTTEDINLYDSLVGYKFFRLVRGRNDLAIAGNGSVAITCEYPVNIGG